MKSLSRLVCVMLPLMGAGCVDATDVPRAERTPGVLLGAGQSASERFEVEARVSPGHHVSRSPSWRIEGRLRPAPAPEVAR